MCLFCLKNLDSNPSQRILAISINEKVKNLRILILLDRKIKNKVDLETVFNTIFVRLGFYLRMIPSAYYFKCRSIII